MITIKKNCVILMFPQKSEKPTSRSQENRPQEVGKSDPNYINNNYTEQNHKDMSYINPINQSGEIVDNTRIQIWSTSITGNMIVRKFGRCMRKSMKRFVMWFV